MDDKKPNNTAESYKRGVTPDSLKIQNNGNSYNGNGMTTIHEGIENVQYSIDIKKDDK